MAPPHRSPVLLTAAGLVLGAALGWLAGLVRAPRGSGGEHAV